MTRIPCTKENPMPQGKNKMDYDHAEAKYKGDDYGSLASGGSYAIYDCSHCGSRFYEQLPD